MTVRTAKIPILMGPSPRGISRLDRPRIRVTAADPESSPEPGAPATPMDSSCRVPEATDWFAACLLRSPTDRIGAVRLPWRNVRAGGLVALVLVVVSSGCVGPVPPLQAPADIGCDKADVPVTVTVSSQLDPACTYHRSFEITASNVVLDCRGAHMELTDPADQRGILIHAPSTVALSTVVVHNCDISGGVTNSIRVSRDGFKSLEAGHEYDAAFSNIVIEDSHLSGSKGSGIFVDGYVSGVTMQRVEIEGAGSVGIYLEAGSKDNVVDDNSIHGNGFGDVDPAGKPFSFGGTTFLYVSTGREGIAVDGSRSNRITRNRLSANSAGGIFLYKNCGEHHTSQPAQWWERRYGADANLIEGNTVSGERNGVWIGSRMAENQYLMDCSDPKMVDGAYTAIHRDYARDNIVRSNTFESVDNGVRIEDDRTTVEANTFLSDDPADQAIHLGTTYRPDYLGEPVADSVITANVATITGNPEPYVLAHADSNTTFEANTSNGSPAGLRSGSQPDIDPFLFVRSFWLP